MIRVMVFVTKVTPCDKGDVSHPSASRARASRMSSAQRARWEQMERATSARHKSKTMSQG